MNPSKVFILLLASLGPRSLKQCVLSSFWSNLFAKKFNVELPIHSLERLKLKDVLIEIQIIGKSFGNLNFEKKPTYLVIVITGRGNREDFVRSSVS